jgi:hypothetical protein
MNAEKRFHIARHVKSRKELVRPGRGAGCGRGREQAEEPATAEAHWAASASSAAAINAIARCFEEFRPVCTENLSSGVVVVKSAKDGV